MTLTNPGFQRPHLNREKIKGQRFLILSSVFPPDIIGGAEISAHNLAQWLRRQGAEVGVLTTAKSPDEICNGMEIDGLKTWRVWIPRAYPQIGFAKAKWWQKPLWHLQDHIDPRNSRIVARVLDEFKPDFVNIHVLQGIGYNALGEIGKRRIPTLYFLHDFALACFRMGMFRNGRECAGQCVSCKISSAYKLHCARKLPVLEFCSPSRIHLETLARYFPVKQWSNTSIINANCYPAPTVGHHVETDHIRFLYVGRLHASKGVHILLDAAQNLAAHYKFTLTIIGSGPDESALREKYGHMPWCRFTGFVTQQDISNAIINSDVLCVPSVWSEPLGGGSIIHALSLGLPVIGSNKGGIPELIEHGKNGLLVPPGDKVAWQNALAGILDNPSSLRPWRSCALENAYKFDQDYLGNKILDFIFS